MRLLITGASGFVGWNAVRYFIDRGIYVQPTFHSLPHYLHNHSERSLSPVQLSVQDGDAVEEVVNRFQPDIILHAAAKARPQLQHSSDILYQVNVIGTRNVARAASDSGAHIIFLSTDFVYAPESGLVNEESPVTHTGTGGYGDSKLEGEKEIREHADRWTIIRPTTMFGIGTPRSNSFTQFLDRKWEAGEAAPVFSDQFRSFLYVEDLLAAIELLMEREDSYGQLYLCGGEEGISRADFALRYAAFRCVDSSLCTIITTDQLEGYIGGPSDIRLDTTKLRTPGWQPRSLEVAFQHMISTRAKTKS